MMGFGLAIDDYGTGRSNLQLLARIPFSELKIDRSFVDGASKKRPLGTVLKSCLGLAHSLDRMSVAVGVETRQDWDFLQGWAARMRRATILPIRWRPGVSRVA
jgi:EAL domain-containing protein (putative c-di-GMP-specific phosphodiesterase class I)